MMEQVTLGQKHLSCGMVIENSACEDEDAEDHDCCENEYTQVNVDDNFAKVSFNITFDQVFAATFVSVFVLQTPVEELIQSENFSDYNPPPLIKDIPVLYETFLIWLVPARAGISIENSSVYGRENL